MRRSPVRARRCVRRTERRRGVALALALVALVVLALLAVGAFYASALALATSEGAELEARAFAAAENGLARSVGARAPTLTLPPPHGVRIGETRDARVATGRDSAHVRTTRLALQTFWVVSEGRAARADGAPPAVRLTSALLRLAVADPARRAAVTAGGDVWVGGSTQIRGGELAPPGWIECDTLGPSSAGHAGVLVAPGRMVSVEPGASVSGSPTPGSPATAEDAAAGSPGTYTNFGDEDWAALVRRADIEVSGVVDPAPSASAGVCDTSGSRALSDWGEPWRGAASVVACSAYFPVIHAPAALAVSAGRGQGILLVEGDLRVDGRFEFTGLVVVRGAVHVAPAAGALVLRGALLVAGGGGTAVSELAGASVLEESACAVEVAALATGRLVPARDWWWAPLLTGAH